uniref:Flagellar associated protein n=2 Tax=Tetraselmis sp. GSL018 TaxID=582737 RepID=A0A061RAH5_9CHLO
MLRGDLHLILFHVLDRHPTAEELDVFLTFFDTETSALISKEEFCRSVARLKGRCASPRYPRDYTSHRLFTDDLTKHRRLEYDPMTTFRRAVTNTQEFGWHTAARTAQPSRYFPLSSTDVSRNEGSQPSNYFGTCH